MCVTLNFFLVKYVHIDFSLVDVMFSNLTKNTWKKFGKKVSNEFLAIQMSFLKINHS